MQLHSSHSDLALNDAVQYIYDQDYVKKDEAGNGLVTVSGHSMGGFSTTMAMVMDEQGFAQTGIRKIHAGLIVGADFLWTSYLEVTGDVAGAAIGPRISGIIAAHYDEFFFDMAAAAESKPVVQKDYLKQAEGLAFLGNPENPVLGEFYSLENGGLESSIPQMKHIHGTIFLKKPQEIKSISTKKHI